MDYQRLPRQLLFGWVRNLRLSGGRRITYGIWMQRVLKTALRRSASRFVAPSKVDEASAGFSSHSNEPTGVGWFTQAVATGTNATNSLLLLLLPTITTHGLHVYETTTLEWFWPRKLRPKVYRVTTSTATHSTLGDD